MNILVSACLLGVNCRYNAVTVETEAVAALAREHTLIPVCPEQLGGMSTPREPSERREGRVYSRNGADVTDHYASGAAEALKIARLCSCSHAVLKERSPSCGAGQIYDGSFSGTLIDGDGVTAELLKANGIEVTGESNIASLTVNGGTSE